MTGDEANGEEIRDVVRARVAEVLELSLEEVPRNADLRDDLDVDSLQKLEFVSSIEYEHQVKFEDAEVADMRNIDDIVVALRRRLAAP